MPFIIAEVGSNYKSLQDCLDSISMAKQVGADAVKFQLYTFNELYGFDPWREDIKDLETRANAEDVDGVRISCAMEKHELPKDWLPKLKEKADAVGIELMCTAFSPEGLEYVDRFVKRHKIASSEISHVPLLNAARKTKKPVIISTGGASPTDIALALNYSERVLTTLLYCVSVYPSTNVDLQGITKLREEFNLATGYSCHTAEWTTPVLAALHYGAEVIEKHFKLRDMDTPDNPHSILPDDFKLMARKIEGSTFVPMPRPDESDMKTLHKRRLIATSQIPKGFTLNFGFNYGIYRSKVSDRRGLTGFLWEIPNGRQATKDILAGDPIGPSDFI